MKIFLTAFAVFLFMATSNAQLENEKIDSIVNTIRTSKRLIIDSRSDTFFSPKNNHIDASVNIRKSYFSIDGEGRMIASVCTRLFDMDSIVDNQAARNVVIYIDTLFFTNDKLIKEVYKRFDKKPFTTKVSYFKEDDPEMADLMKPEYPFPHEGWWVYFWRPGDLYKIFEIFRIDRIVDSLKIKKAFKIIKDTVGSYRIVKPSGTGYYTDVYYYDKPGQLIKVVSTTPKYSATYFFKDKNFLKVIAEYGQNAISWTYKGIKGDLESHARRGTDFFYYDSYDNGLSETDIQNKTLLIPFSKEYFHHLSAGLGFLTYRNTTAVK